MPHSHSPFVPLLLEPALSAEGVFSSLLADFFTSRRKRRRGRQQAASPLQVLEDRAMLSAIVVTSLADNTDVDGQVTLREAVQAANTDTSVDGSAAGSGADVITFAPELDGRINMDRGQILITSAVTITGNGALNTIVDAQQASRILHITSDAGDVFLNKLTLTNGSNVIFGGAIYSASFSELTISDSTLSGNSPSNTAFSAAQGGAIWVARGALTVVRSTLSGNQAASTVGYGYSLGGAIFSNNGDVTISQSTLSGNSAPSTRAASRGGAVFARHGAVTITESTISGNSAVGRGSFGGAVFALDGAMTITQSTLSGNIATGDGSIGGGAVFAYHGALTISQSTLSGNSATGGGQSRGGAIVSVRGALTISQSTVFGNSTADRNNSGGGGGIFTYASSATANAITNSIVAGNTAPNNPDLSVARSLTVRNSLIGRNNGTALPATVGTTPDANGNFIGGNTDALKIEPQLLPLANNGGPTLTHALLSGSLAIDHGNNALAVDVTNGNAALISDQRGAPFTRILDGDHRGAATVDMGAFEFSGLRVVSPNPNALSLRPTFQWTPIAGATSYTIQIDNESTNVAHFHDATSSVASYTPGVDLAIGKFKMWVRPNFGATTGNWSAPHLFNNVTRVTWQTTPRTQLTSRPTLNWNALPGAAKYDLWVNNISTGQQQFLRQEVTGSSFTPAADLPMGLYRCWIRGVDAKGNFAWWSVMQELLVVPGPTPVGPLSATFDRTPTFSWNPVTGAASYELYVRNQITGEMAINGQSVVGTSFTPASNLTDGPYRWWTLAVSEANIGPIKSGGSNPVDVFVGGRPTIIAPVAGSSTSDRRPTFTWRAVDGAASYQLTVSRTSAPQANVISQTGLASTSFTPASNLTAGNYRAWVRAVSTTGELSPWSIEVSFTITATAPAIDPPDTDLTLAGLLTSALAKPDDGDTDSSPLQTVEHPQSEVTAHDPDSKVAIRMRSSGLFVSPDVSVQKQYGRDVDRLMAEFALHEFTTAAIPAL